MLYADGEFESRCLSDPQETANAWDLGPGFPTCNHRLRGCDLSRELLLAQTCVDARLENEVTDPHCVSFGFVGFLGRSTKGPCPRRRAGSRDLPERRLFRGRRSGKAINPRWLELHYPLYWHYDILHGLLLLSRVVGLTDPRVNEALDILESKRRPDGTWRAGGSYWKPPGRTVTGVDVVDWGRSGPNQMIMLNALRVLRAAGRL